MFSCYLWQRTWTSSSFFSFFSFCLMLILRRRMSDTVTAKSCFEYNNNVVSLKLMAIMDRMIIVLFETVPFLLDAKKRNKSNPIYPFSTSSSSFIDSYPHFSLLPRPFLSSITDLTKLTWPYWLIFLKYGCGFDYRISPPPRAMK